MRCVSILLVVSLGLFAAVPARAQYKPSIPPGSISSQISEVGGKTLKQWVQETRSSDPSVREEAVRAIMLFGESAKEAGPALIDRLKDPDASVRTYAALTLGQVGVAETDVIRAVEGLSWCVLNDQQAIVRYHAAMALGGFGADAKAAIPRLVTKSRDNSSWQIRRAVVFALGKAGGDVKNGPDPRAVNALVNVINGGEPTDLIRLEAVMALGTMGVPALPADRVNVESCLVRAIRDPDKRVSIWARVALMALKDEVDDKELAEIAKFLKHPQSALKVHAARAFGAIGRKAKAHVPELVEALQDKDPMVVFTAIESLGQMGGAAEQATTVLYQLVRARETEDSVRLAARNLLEKIEGKSLSP